MRKISPRKRAKQLGCERLEARDMFAVTYHGGALLANVETQAVYLGTDWTSNASLVAQRQKLDDYLNYLVQSPYMDMLSNAGYGVGRGSSTSGQTLSVNLATGSTITDAQIRAQLQSGISSSQLQQPDANRLYVVYVEPGVIVKDGADTSASNFLGYHGAFAGRDANGKTVDIRYAVMPYPGSPNPSAASQGFSQVVDELTMVTSHELAEAVTDPDVNYKQVGWYDDRNNGEIGDLTSRTTTLHGYVVQGVVDKSGRVVLPSDSSPTNPITPTEPTTPTNPTAIAAPTHLVATMVSATRAHLTWDAVSGARGYRIYSVTNGVNKLLGTVSAQSTSVDVSNLTAGSTVNLMVQAVGSTSTANSDVASVTLPTVASTLTAPVVSASVVTSREIQLSWAAVSGADGYRVYRVVGSRVVYVGTVSGSSTSANIRGLSAGSTTQWIVQAYNTDSVANSAAVSVTTTRRTSIQDWWSTFFG